MDLSCINVSEWFGFTIDQVIAKFKRKGSLYP